MEGQEGPQRETRQALDSALEEHLPNEMIVAWTIEVLDEMGLGRPETIPEEVGFQVRQRVIQHLADRTAGTLAAELRATYRYNEEHGLEES